MVGSVLASPARHIDDTSDSCVLLLGAPGSVTSTLIGALRSEAGDVLRCLNAATSDLFDLADSARQRNVRVAAETEFRKYQFTLTPPGGPSVDCTVIDTPSAVFDGDKSDSKVPLLTQLLRQNATGLIVCIERAAPDDQTAAQFAATLESLRLTAPGLRRIALCVTTDQSGLTPDSLDGGPGRQVLEAVAELAPQLPIGITSATIPAGAGRPVGVLATFLYAAGAAKPAAIPEQRIKTAVEQFAPPVQPASKWTGIRRALRPSAAILIALIPTVWLVRQWTHSSAPVLDPARIELAVEQFSVSVVPVAPGSDTTFRVEHRVGGLPEGIHLPVTERLEISRSGGPLSVRLIGEPTPPLINGIQSRSGHFLIPNELKAGQYQISYIAEARPGGGAGVTIRSTGTSRLTVTARSSTESVPTPRVKSASELVTGSGRSH